METEFRGSALLADGLDEHPIKAAVSVIVVSRRLIFRHFLLRDIIRGCSIQIGSGLIFRSVAILCRSGAAEAANYVTFPAPKSVRKGLFKAALSDILFNKVKHLGHFLGNSREISPD